MLCEYCMPHNEVLGRERENYSNSKTFILKDSSVRSILTYLTASRCYTTNTNMHDYTTNRYIISTNKQLINEVSQSSYKYAETEIKFLSHNQIFRRTCDSNKSLLIWREVIFRHIFVQITFETRKTNTGFYVYTGRDFQRDAPERERERDLRMQYYSLW